MLPIRRTCHFLLDTQKGWDSLKIRYRIRYGGYVTSIFVGHRAEPKKWSTETERCLKGSTHGEDKISASVINRALQATEEAVESAFAYYEELEQLPTPDQLKDKYKELVGDRIGRRRPASSKSSKSPLLMDYWGEYIALVSASHGWTRGYIRASNYAANRVAAALPQAKLSEVSAATIADLVRVMSEHMRLANSTIGKTIVILKAYLHWCKDKGYIPGNVDIHHICKVKLRGRSVSKAEVYLTMEEVHRFSAQKPLSDMEEDAQDIFIFMCFTGLRYSDASALRWDDIKDNKICLHTKKTNTYLEIDVNDYSQRILDKRFADPNRSIGLIFRKRSAGNINDAIKRIAKRAKISTKISRLRYSGGRSETITQPKYKWISTHTGRHTFVVAALSLGIPIDVIRKFTGHSSHAAILPYIDIVDGLKRQEMAKFNRPLLGDSSAAGD